MPNIKGRQADFIAKHGSMEREHPIVETVAGETKRWPCPDCKIVIVPEGQRCTPCACAAVEEWKAARLHVVNRNGWGKR